MNPERKPVVLVVEDDVDISTLVKHVLEDVDCTILQARDGERAIEIAAREHVDVMLLDERLPLMRGEEVAARLQEQPDSPQIIVFSASADLAGIAARIGAFGYLHKPFDLNELVEIVERALDQSREAVG